jgi:hypothetical protein
MSASGGKLRAEETFMGIRFYGIDPDNPGGACPAVFRDEATGDFLFQGKTVADPVIRAKITAHSPILEDEAIVRLPARMAAVVLLKGSAAPAYRALSKGMSGTDVHQLNGELVALGYATRAQLNPHSRTFGAATAHALKKLQAHVGVKETGKLDLGQAVFLPRGTVRITKVNATYGGPAAPGTPMLQAGSTTRRVTVALDASGQSQVKVGDKVTITLPNGRTTPGKVSSVGTVAKKASSGSTINVTITAVKGWAVIIPPLAWGGGFGAAMAIGAIAGLLPALRAARMPPTEALRAG